jgi:ubiquitin carboxyl-terminal hydrolase 34
LDNITTSINQGSDCSQYFAFVQQLFEETYQLEGEGEGKDSKESEEHKEKLEELLVTLIQALKNHKSIETRRGGGQSSATDSLLVGLLSLIKRILVIKPDLKRIAGDPKSNDLINELFRNCLFDLKERDGKFEDYTEDSTNNEELKKDYIKCKSDVSRQMAYDLLYELCRDCIQNLNYFFSEGGFLEMSQKAPKDDNRGGWFSWSNDNQRSEHGFAGLKNLGCICYMNAMNQQFYLTETFRYLVLMASDGQLPQIEKVPGIGEMDDNPFHQLQRMYTYLELTDREYYNPEQYCHSFKDYAGKPVNTRIQKDAQEYLNQFFDKIENALKPTPFKNIVKDVYGGNNTNLIMCQNPDCLNVN